MSLRGKLYLMCLMLLTAGFVGSIAYETVVPQNTGLPEELYEKLIREAGEARYYMRLSDGKVAVYADSREKSLISVTKIPASTLRRADRAMLAKGIPVATGRELLLLLEDLSV